MKRAILTSLLSSMIWGLEVKKLPKKEHEISLKTLKSHLNLKYYYCQQSNCIISFLFLCLAGINVCKLALPSSFAHTFFLKILVRVAKCAYRGIKINLLDFFCKK